MRTILKNINLTEKKKRHETWDKLSISRNSNRSRFIKVPLNVPVECALFYWLSAKNELL